jgi:hypothetical protein
MCNLYDLGTCFKVKTRVSYKGEDFSQNKRQMGEFFNSKNGLATLRNGQTVSQNSETVLATVLW